MGNDLKLEGYRIGFLGLGNMGWPMAGHLHRAGAELWVWNRSELKREMAREMGMRVVDQPIDVVKAVEAGHVCLNLTTTEVVRELVDGNVGIGRGLSPAITVIDFGTTDVAATRVFGGRFRWVDAPVSGGQVGAEAASLSIMVGGEAADVEEARPLMECLGKRVTHLGPSGSGQVVKLVNQLIVAQTIDAVAQALRLAELAGVSAAAAREAMLGGFADSRILELHGRRIAERDFKAGGRAALQLKDVRLIAKLAGDVGFQSPTLDNSLVQWERLVEELGLGDIDHSGLFKLYE